MKTIAILLCLMLASLSFGQTPPAAPAPQPVAPPAGMQVLVPVRTGLFGQRVYVPMQAHLAIVVRPHRTWVVLK